MLVKTAKSPIKSVAVVTTDSNKHVASIIRNLLFDQGISTGLQVELPFYKSARSLFWRTFVIKLDKL